MKQLAVSGELGAHVCHLFTQPIKLSFSHICRYISVKYCLVVSMNKVKTR